MSGAPRRAHATPWVATAAIIRLRVRTHRWALIGWALSIPGLVTATAFGIRQAYATDAARAAYRATVGESAISIALNGRGYELDRIGGIVLYELGFYGLLVFPLIALHLAILLTRTEEEAGRDELLTANRIGLRAPLAAGAIAVSVSLVAASALTAVGLMTSGLSMSGSIVYGIGLGLTLLAWAAVGLIAAQLSRSGRGAHAFGLVTLGGLYMARALVDGRGLSLTWANPTGWLAEVRPFGERQWWPLALSAGLAVALVVGAFALRTGRDLGTGVLPERSGRPHAKHWMRTPAGLSWRLARAPLMGWAIAAIIWGGLLGLMAPEMRRLLEANPQLASYLGGSGAQGNHLLITMSALLSALVACAFGVQMIVRMAGDESSARTGLVLATGIGRLRWLASEFALATFGATSVIVAGGLATDLALVAIGEADTRTAIYGAGLQSALAMLPGVLVIVGASAVAWSIVPRLAHLGWALLGWASIVGLLADALHLPAWSRDLSPLHHVGQVPVTAVSVPATLSLLAIAVAMVALAAVRFDRRDLISG